MRNYRTSWTWGVMLGLMLGGQMRCTIGQRVWVTCGNLGNVAGPVCSDSSWCSVVFGDRCFFPLGAGRAFLPWGFHDLSGGRKAKGKSQWPFCFCCSLKLLHLEILKISVFGGSCVLNPVIHSPVWNSPKKFYSVEAELVDCPKPNPINHSLSSGCLYGNKRKIKVNG